VVLLRFLRAALALVPLVTLAACGGGDLVLPSDGGPSRIRVVTGDGQSGLAGAALEDSLVAKVVDAQDRGLSGVRVAFVPGTAGSEVAPDTVLTDANGEAATQWVLGGPAGSQVVDANVVGASLTARFTASVAARAASRLSSVAGDEQAAPVGTALADSLAVRAEDEFGNPVAGVQVEWSADVGEVSPASVVTGADGRAATRRILGARAGEQTATARAEGLVGSPVTFTHTAVPGSAASIVLVSGNDQNGTPGQRLPNPLVVRVVD
jgi:hypothetical protein